MSDGYRNYGPLVSESPQPVSSGGAFSGDDRSYESVVVQAEAPVIDWEMNLRSQVAADYGLRQSNQRLRVSCFLGGDFLERSEPSGSYAYPPASMGNENRLYLLADHALINGWQVRVEFSDINAVGLNLITFPDPPASTTRTDLVILEVWRALLRAAPDVSNKSATGLILRNGNVKAPDSVNLTDDLVDPTYGLESNARVQIQYRLRVISGVDIDAFPDGLDDPTVVANSVSDFGGPGADGSPTIYTYSVTDFDKSLWRAGAGDGTSAASLGTVDGFMYAVPVCAVRRRNTGAFNRTTNMNGAPLILAGVSDRPDGLFSDQIVASDLVDLRRGASDSYEEVLEKAFQQVLDNSMSTRGVLSDLGTGGTSFLYRDDVGDAGTSPSGTTDDPGNPDGVRRYFSDRSVTDTIVFVLSTFTDSFGYDISDVPATNPAGAAALPWDLAAATSILANAPIGTNIVELVSLRMTTASADVDLFDPNNPSGVHVMTVTYGDGIDGTNTFVSVVLNSPATGAVYAEVMLEYPAGSGLSRNIVEEYQFWAPLGVLPSWVDTSTWTTAPSDGSRGIVPDDTTTPYDGSQWWLDAAHRELAVRHRTTALNWFGRAAVSDSSLTGSDFAATVDTTVNNVLEVRTDPLAAYTAITIASDAAMAKGNPTIVGSDTAANVNTSTEFTVIVRSGPTGGFTSIPVPQGASVSKTDIADAINVFAGLTNVSASVNGTNQLVLSSTTGYVEVDSVANGSDLNNVVGFNVAGQALTSVVAELNFIASPNLNDIGASASVVGTNQIRIESTTGYLQLNTDPPSLLNTPLGFSPAGDVSGSSFVLIPERLTGDPVTVTDGINAPYQTTSYTVNTAYTRVELTYPIASSTFIQIEYTAYRPPPPVSSSLNTYNVFYRSRAMQTLPPPASLSVSLPLTPRAIGRAMSVIVTGPGSPDDSFPFTAPGDQIPVGALPIPDYPESRLDGPADVYLADFNINTGFMQLQPYVPYVPNAGQVTLYRDVADITEDAEGRSFWPKSFNIAETPVYSPAIFAQELFFGRRHKVALPVLMELKEDFDGVGQKGMLVLVVFTAWLEFDPECRIVLLPTLGDACAGVYRVRGNMMSMRRPTY